MNTRSGSFSGGDLFWLSVGIVIVGIWILGMCISVAESRNKNKWYIDHGYVEVRVKDGIGDIWVKIDDVKIIFGQPLEKK